MDPVDPRIEEHLEFLGAADKSGRTIGAARLVLYRADRDLQPYGLRKAATDEINRWLNQFHDRQTKATYGDHLRRFYRWATESDDPYLDWNPMARLPRPPRRRGIPRPCTVEQARACVTRTAWPFRLHCLLAAQAGLRPVEIAALRREDVTADDLLVRHGKGDRAAVLQTHPDIWAAVRDLPAGPVTHTLRGHPASAGWVASRTGQHLREIGIVGVTLRNLRHFYATSMLEAVRDLRVVQENMRHASVTSTQIYTQVVEARRRAAILARPSLRSP